MDAILNCKAEDLEDYYGLLGCDELSSSEQILAEYKVRALECHPDKNPGNPKAAGDFQRLQEAKKILTNESTRNNYNFWRRSKITMPFRDWQALGDSVKGSMHWAVKSKEPMLEESKDTPLLSPQDAVSQIEKVPSTEMEFPDTVNTLSHCVLIYLKVNWQTYATSDLLIELAIMTVPPTDGGNYCHLHFRWAADTPSGLLRKFRNYEI